MNTKWYDKYFQKSLEHAVGKEQARSILYGDVDANGQRISKGLVDDVSQRFVIENVHKPAVTIAPFARSDGVLAQTEIPSMLNRPGGLLEGMDRKVFSHISDTSPRGIRDAQQVISTLSLESTSTLSYHVDPDGKLVGVDTSKFWSKELSDLAHSPLETGSVKTIKQADLFAHMDDAQRARFTQGVKLLDDAVPGNKEIKAMAWQFLHVVKGDKHFMNVVRDPGADNAGVNPTILSIEIPFTPQ